MQRDKRTGAMRSSVSIAESWHDRAARALHGPDGLAVPAAIVQGLMTPAWHALMRAKLLDCLTPEQRERFSNLSR